jgi:hypothetical protein
MTDGVDGVGKGDGVPSCLMEKFTVVTPVLLATSSGVGVFCSSLALSELTLEGE